jgi:dTDP-4-dehydrorhamnose 3,5-epimerase
MKIIKGRCPPADRHTNHVIINNIGILFQMKLIETSFKGLYIVQPKVFTDARGYFFESYRHDKFIQAGISFMPIQDNESRSSRGVIRGLHYQLNPHAQAKLIRVVEGRVFDVAVDLRRDSETYGKWFGIELNSENKTQLFIPRGFAHGFSVISNIAVIQYKCDNIYNPRSERGIMYNDPELDIRWGFGDYEPIVSEKDKKHPCLKDAENNF